MEEIKSSVRKYDVNQQYKQSLKGPPHYYRISVNSANISATSSVTDAVFNVKQVFPNHRADMLSGEWHAFLESFEGKLDSQAAKTSVKFCLPDLVRSSQDYVMTVGDVCQINDTIEHIPVPTEYRAPGVATYNVPEILGDGTREEYAVPAVPADAPAPLPITKRNHISVDSIGVKIDPVSLFSGQLRVVLRDEGHAPLVEGAGLGEVNPNTGEGWRATVLFVHKA